jgi:LPXTG-site transpeptidase (sortase) family protein
VTERERRGSLRSWLVACLAVLSLAAAIVAVGPWIDSYLEDAATRFATLEPILPRTDTEASTAVVEPEVVASPIAADGVEEEDSEDLPSPPVLAQAPKAIGRMAIPRIGLDSDIVETYLQGSEWPIPKFVVGHLGESPRAGAIGNAVFAGHLQSIASGNVFANLDRVVVGDQIIYTDPAQRQVFRVIETRVVANTDVSVLSPRPGKATVTLITCAGTWIPKDNDYDQRIVVIGEAVNA